MEKRNSKISIRIKDIKQIQTKGKMYVIEMNFDGAELRFGSCKQINGELKDKIKKLEKKLKKVYKNNLILEEGEE